MAAQAMEATPTNSFAAFMRLIDVRAVGLARTAEEKARRHINGDNGAKYSKGRYEVMLGRTLGTMTTAQEKDNKFAMIYETE